MPADAVLGRGILFEVFLGLANVSVVKLETSVVAVSVLASESILDVAKKLADARLVGEPKKLLANVNVVTLESQAVTVSVLPAGSGLDVGATLVAPEILLGESTPLTIIVFVVVLESMVVTVVVLAP